MAARILGVARALPGLGTVVSGPSIATALFSVVPATNRLLLRPRPDGVFDEQSLASALAAQGLSYEPLSTRLASATASTRRTLDLLQWLAGLIALAAMWSFLASRAQVARLPGSSSKGFGDPSC